MAEDSNTPAAEPASLLSREFLARLEQLELATRRVFRGRLKGERRGKRRGSSAEFIDFRNYVPGDDLRFLDWNIYGRLDRLFIKLFQEEEDLQVHILIDGSRSMDYGAPSKWHYARQVAAALAFVGLVNMDRVHLSILRGPEEADALPPLRGRVHLWRMLEFLDRAEAAGGCDLEAYLRRYALEHTGQGIVVLLSDFLYKEGYEDALRYPIARSMDLYCLHILAPEEVDPSLAGDLRLIDCEDDDVADVTISAPLLARYRKNLDHFCTSLRDWCHRRSAHYLLCSTAQPADQLVLRHLRVQGLVR